jgi:predicted permease
MSLLADFRFAARALRQSPGLIAVAALSLGLGIGTNVTMFAALDPLVFQPFDLPGADRLVHPISQSAKQLTSGFFSPADFRDFRRQSASLDLSAFQFASYNWSNGDPPEHLPGARAVGGLFEISGITPIVGRTIRPDDEVSGRPVVLISERLWRDRFARDRGVVGRGMVLDGVEHTIIGVLPNDRVFPLVDAEVWTAVPDSDGANRADRSFSVIGRLRSGKSLADAQVELETIARRLADAYPATNQDLGVRLQTFEQELVPSGARQAAVVLFAAVGFVLLIACANVANLLLTRGAGRARELAVRAALGASRGRITRHLLVESLLLAAAGGALGVLLSVAGIAWVRELLSGPGARMVGVNHVRFSERAFGFALAVTGVASLVFGLFPAIRAAAPDLTRSLRDGDRGATGGASHSRLRTALVIGELGLALVLLISATLLIEASLRYHRMDLGFNPRSAVHFATVLTDRRYADSTSRAAFAEAVETSLRSVAGVQVAGVGSGLPLFGGFDAGLRVVGEPEPGARTLPMLVFDISPNYLAAAGMRVVRGRNITSADRLGTPGVALINEATARHHWPNRDPVGQRLRSGATEYTVVGVVNDVLVSGSLDDPPMETAFFALSQRPRRYLSFIVRSDLSASLLAPRLRAAVESVAPGQPIYQLAPLADTARLAWRDYQIMTELLAVLGAAALLLAVIGVYGAMSHAVAQRVPEIGIRRALGADTRDVLRLLGRHGLWIVGLGSLVGVPAAFGMTRLLASMLTGVRSFDAMVFLAVPVGLAVTAIVATLAPARRAVRVDALIALRDQ